MGRMGRMGRMRRVFGDDAAVTTTGGPAPLAEAAAGVRVGDQMAGAGPLFDDIVNRFPPVGTLPEVAGDADFNAEAVTGADNTASVADAETKPDTRVLERKCGTWHYSCS